MTISHRQFGKQLSVRNYKKKVASRCVKMTLTGLVLPIIINNSIINNRIYFLHF